MRGHLRRCWLFHYRAPLEQVCAVLPPELEPVRFGGFGFWNVLVCEVQKIRPKGIPTQLGITFRQVSYRVHARRHCPNSNSIEGLYFVRSDCDSRMISSAGNVLTQFKFHFGKIAINESPVATRLEVDAPNACGQATIHYGRPVRMSCGSPFNSLPEAAEFLRYRPTSLCVNGRGVERLSVQRDESKWKASLVAVHGTDWDFLKDKETALELAYEIAPIDYEWRPAQKAE